MQKNRLHNSKAHTQTHTHTHSFIHTTKVFNIQNKHNTRRAFKRGNVGAGKRPGQKTRKTRQEKRMNRH